MDGNKEIPDIYPHAATSHHLRPGQIFLLCSDGLITESIEAQTGILLKIIQKAPDLKTATYQLIDKAFQNGSSDNITVVLAVYGKIRSKKIQRLIWSVFILVVFAIGVFIYQNKIKPTTNQLMIYQELEQDVDISIKDSIKLADVKWNNPMEEYKNALKRTDPISWKSFPQKEILKHYQIELLEQDQVIEIIKTEQSYILLDQFNRLGSNIYTLRLKAITTLGTITAKEIRIKIIH